VIGRNILIHVFYFALVLSTSTAKAQTPALYVAPNGNDSNAGTVSAPFLTLEKARDAMRASSIKTTYLRAGPYDRSAMLTLTSGDGGQTWQTYPSDGQNMAILDATNMVASPRGGGNQALILIQGGSNITIGGIQMRNFKGSSVQIHGGVAYWDINPIPSPATGIASGNTVKNCYIHDGNQTLDIYPHYGGISAYGGCSKHEDHSQQHKQYDGFWYHGRRAPNGTCGRYECYENRVQPCHQYRYQGF
jgi:hypothetical protein